MTILNLVPNTDPILKKKTEEFDFSEPPIDPSQLAVDLTETMIDKGGIGLASPQVGLPYRAFVISSNPVLAVFNPRIVDMTTEQVILEEGCLSFPGVLCKVKRPLSIKVRYAMPNGEIVTQKFTGMTSRVFQHEMDHLDGVIFLSRANLYHRSQALRRAKKWERSSPSS